MKILAIIPNRAWSKYLPRHYAVKLSVGGIPLLARTIQTAQQSQKITRIIVSTDNEKAKEMASLYGVEAIRHPLSLSSNHLRSGTTLNKIMYTLFWLEEHSGYKPDLIVLLQCTSPLMIGEDIDNTIQAILDIKGDTAISVSGRKDFRRYKPEDYISQIEEPENGAIYVNTWEQIMFCNTMSGKKIGYYRMPVERAIDINKIEDLARAEVLCNLRS